MTLRTPPRPARWRRVTAWLLLAASGATLAQPAAPAAPGNDPVRPPIQLPALGDEAAADFSVGAEARLGERLMREIRRDPAYLDDPELLEYVQGLWQPLLAAARQRGEITPDIDPRFAWEVFLVRDRSVNAFALPGGTVGLHLGLIALTQTPDELASVLAHEMSHVTQRHIARGFANSRRQSLIALAGMILGAVAAARANSPDGFNAAVIGGQAAGVQGQLNFSRDVEREADRIGFAVLGDAGFAPIGMAAMFERLQTSARLNDNGGFPYLRTHPLTSERIAEARARAGLGSGSGDAAARAVAAMPLPTAFAHAIAMARARVLADPRDEPLARWAALDLTAPGPAADRLGRAVTVALAASLRRDAAAATAALEAARAVVAAAPVAAKPAAGMARVQRALALLTAELAVARGDGAAARAALAPYEASGGRAMQLRTAEALLADASAPRAALRERAEALQAWITQHPADAMAWLLSSELWRRLEQPLRAVRAEAEARYALGDLTGASDRLRAGQQAARGTPLDAVDPIESAVIDTRLREIDEQRRQLALEERTAGTR